MTESAMTNLPKSLDDDDASRLIDAMLPVLGLQIAPEWRAAVIANLKTNTALASLVLAFPLPDDEEPAAVFRP